MICPLVVRPIAKRLPVDVHPVIAYTAAMAVVTTLVVTVVAVLPGS